MTAADFATVGYLDQCFRTLIGHIQAIQAPAPPAPQAVLLTYEQVMERLHVSRSAVQRWVKVGKKGRGKTTIKLAVLTFGDAEPRIPWPALLAFGQGEAYDLSQLPAPQLLTALPPPGSALPGHDSQDVMRLAS